MSKTIRRSCHRLVGETYFHFFPIVERTKRFSSPIKGAVLDSCIVNSVSIVTYIHKSISEKNQNDLGYSPSAQSIQTHASPTCESLGVFLCNSSHSGRARSLSGVPRSSNISTRAHACTSQPECIDLSLDRIKILHTRTQVLIQPAASLITSQHARCIHISTLSPGTGVVVASNSIHPTI